VISTQQRPRYNSVLMVRAKTQLNEIMINGTAIEALPRPLLVFLHSGAVVQLASPTSPWVKLTKEADIDLAYCSTAWQRRRSGEPASGVQRSSLLQFWAHQLDCWSASAGSSIEPSSLLIRIGRGQDELGWQESLEVILAAATLEIPMRVQFEDAAWQSLLGVPDQRLAWQQLLDYKLAGIEVLAFDADADQAALGVHYVDPDATRSSVNQAERKLDL